MQKEGLKTGNEEDELGFSKGFFKFVGLKTPQDYLYPPSNAIQTRINDMRKMDTAQSFYTPLDNMYSTGTGKDTWYDFGRVPVSHLEVLSSKRVGALFTACNRPAVDIFDNDWEWVKRNDPEGDAIDIYKNKELEKLQGWMDDIRFKRKLMDIVDFDARTGLGHLVVDKYLHEPRLALNWQKQAPKTHPESFVTFSSYFMTPTNNYQPNHLDYDRSKWNFTGGLNGAFNIHHSRVFVYEGLREPMGLRGIALGELCWTAWMCYLNIQYYILKGLAQLGTVTVGISVDREFPTTAETTQYLALLKTMRANNFYVLGRGAQLHVENAAAKLGGGIKDFMEFLKEDISAATVFPKNQMFGRPEGGGLAGAGAVVSKEDYLASNLSPKQSKIKPDMMWILRNMCGFSGLEGIIPRFKIDLHKTQEQRFKEQLMKEQVSQTEMMTEQMELSQGLFKKQIKLQKEMADVQLKMLQDNPEQLLQQSDKDEENLEEKKPQAKDFTSDFAVLNWRLDLLKRQYVQNDTLLKYINSNAQIIHSTLDNENEAFKRLFLKR